MLSKISERQAERIAKEKRKGMGPDLHLLLKEDLIGPRSLQSNCSICGLVKLRTDGLEAVKESIRKSNSAAESNYQRELLEKNQCKRLSIECFWFTGTGKTTVAKLYGQILRTSVSLVMAKVKFIDRRTIVTNHFPLC